MLSGSSIACVCEVVVAFLGGVGSEKLADGGDEGFERARRRLAQQMLQFGEDLFDRVQIGRIFGKKEQLGAGRSDRPANGFPLWLPRLSMITRAPGARVGASPFST